MTIYLLSGLGVDKSVFQFIQFPAESNIEFLDWIEPQKDEDLQSYARRIAEKVKRDEPFLLIGLSFGGMVACEMQEILKPKKTILISSVCRRQELPRLYRLAGNLHLLRLMPSKHLLKPNRLLYWLFGIKKEKDRKHLKEILVNTNPGFSKWAMTQIVNWKREKITEGIIRIHGDSDRVLPINHFEPKYRIVDGGHFMIVTHSSEISKILDSEFN